MRETFAGSTELTNTRLSHSEALPLIQNVLHISDKHRTEGDIRKAADLILNLMMNLYDVYVFVYVVHITFFCSQCQTKNIL